MAYHTPVDGQQSGTSVRYGRDRRRRFIDALWQDLAYALRQLRGNPAFAAAAVLTLALGIGANSAIYQVLDAVVFRSLPVRDPASLVQVQLLENNQPIHISYPFYKEMAARQQVLDGLFAVSDFPLRQAVLRGRGSSRAVKGSIVSGNYFRVLGVSARAGRVFTEDDDRPAAAPVIVISDAFWNREFARSPTAIGQVLEINGASGTVIGVTPPEFFGETVGTVPDLWLPISFQPQFMPADWLNAPSHSWLSMLGRLRRGVSGEPGAGRARAALPHAIESHGAKQRPRLPGPASTGQPRHRRSGTAIRRTAVGADGNHRPGIADCVQQPGQFAAGPGYGAHARNRCPAGAGRRPLAHRPPAAYRRTSAFGVGNCLRSAAGHPGSALAGWLGIECGRLAPFPRVGMAPRGLHRRRGSGVDVSVRARPRLDRYPCGRAIRAAGLAARVFRRPLPQSPGKIAGGGADLRVAHDAFRRGAAHPLPLESAAPGFWF